MHTRPNPFDAPVEVVKSNAVAKPAAQPLEFGLRGAREFSSYSKSRPRETLCEDRVLGGPGSGKKSSKGKKEVACSTASDTLVRETPRSGALF